jgi:hypothetical protein
MSMTFFALLHKHRETCRRLAELEAAELDRRIAALGRAKPRSGAAPAAGREHEWAMLRVMQAADTPLPPREIAQRLGQAPKTVSRWLAAAHRRGTCRPPRPSLPSSARVSASAGPPAQIVGRQTRLLGSDGTEAASAPSPPSPPS